MTYEEMKPSKADRKKFDIDLEKGEIGEQAIADIFTNKKLEVKSEIDKWARQVTSVLSLNHGASLAV